MPAPPRQRRWPLVLATVPLIAVLALWLRSYWRLDALSRVRADDGTTQALVAYRGAVHLIRAGTNARPREVRRDVYRIPAGATYATLHRVGAVEWQYLGFARVRTGTAVTVAVPGTAGVAAPGLLVTITPPPGGVWTLPFGPSPVAELMPWLQMPPYDALIIPLWPLTLLAAIYPALAARKSLRAWLRRRRGACPACGYDLRASPGR